MRKTQLPKRERDVCRRLREARDLLGLTHAECAAQIGVPRTTLINYELGKAPVRAAIGLKFCRQFIISEEWLATGRFDAVEQAALKHGFTRHSNFQPLHEIFRRQCVDLDSEAAARRLRPGMLLSDAFAQYLAHRYAELVQQSFHMPRILITEADNEALFSNLLDALFKRYIALLSNEATRRRKEPKVVHQSFVGAIVRANYLIFAKFMGFPIRKLDKDHFLSVIVNEPNRAVGPLFVEPEQSLSGSRVEVAPAN